MVGVTIINNNGHALVTGLHRDCTEFAQEEPLHPLAKKNRLRTFYVSFARNIVWCTLFYITFLVRCTLFCSAHEINVRWLLYKRLAHDKKVWMHGIIVHKLLPERHAYDNKVWCTK